MNTFKIILVGDSKMGKDTWIKKIINRKFNKEYLNRRDFQHLKPQNIKILFNTNTEPTIFDIWVLSENDKKDKDRKKIYEDADAAIVMYDGSIHYFGYCNWWYEDISWIKDIPIVFVGNFCDKESTKKMTMMFRKFTTRGGKEIPIYNISVKTGLNFMRPFVSLARTLTRNQDVLIQNCSLAPR